MSSIVTEQGILHFESIGRGEPIILLHGWINSWAVWRDAMIALADTNRYRVHALDFWGFGESAQGKNAPPDAFNIESYVEMVNQFMVRMGIEAAPVFGHSMGGTVALQMALDHPTRVRRVAIVGSPISGRTLNPLLQLAGYGQIARLVWHYPLLLRMTMQTVLARDSRRVRAMIFHDVQRASLESFFRSIGDLRDTDLTGNLQRLAMPTMGIFGARDNIVSPRNAAILRQHMPEARVALLPASRHFPMIDEPERFLELLDQFLARPEPHSSEGSA